MKYYINYCLIIIFLVTTGCSKSEDNPVNTNAKGTISGTIKNAFTNQPVAGVKVTLTQTSTKAVTDNNGAFTFSDVAEGTYSITTADAGYKTATVVNIAVTKGNTTAANASIQPFVWKIPNSDNNATVALPMSTNPNINGVTLAAGDVIGCFYDSLGSAACAGYTEIAASMSTAIPVAVWGDDGSTSGKKEGFSNGDAISWKVKRKSDGKIFDATATYKDGTGTYSSNGTYVITKFTVITE